MSSLFGFETVKQEDDSGQVGSEQLMSLVDVKQTRQELSTSENSDHTLRDIL
jgi:hypothetical protein